jgi:two-component system capsular synthesis response regulator RcsB
MFAQNHHPLRVMLLDDHEFILDGMSLTLSTQSDISVVGRYASSQALFSALQRSAVDVVVMDYCLQPGEVDGLNLIRALRIRSPQSQVLVVSALHTPSTVALALRCGARGFIGKELDAQVLAQGIRKVATGQVYLYPSMARQLVENDVCIRDMPAASSLTTPAGGALIKNSELTVREHEVLRCCLHGLTVTEIAAKFSRSVKTISAQKQSAFRKLGLRNNNELFKIRPQLDGWQ